ncbi:uncharacterized protein N7473_010714 [Penicillium subrubescens]|uniref:Uncharacterized protein n=1 Tax=Penicillium subrubescens TaxID=1316194 RepID=A0A1Q5T2Y3_9EURO|nr:uncharacterized protein N7473_010714 [Penicillium subrubescens]KAJ5883828.1 hypothetical protein N7473_010714 [Penicillium subrubescens]OKO94567.1 hypothetical protein PENSUB_11834 [Penicillium subrubescens]
MPAITVTNQPQGTDMTTITKRGNWASREPGVILVFAIVFLVGLGIVSLFVYRKWMARKAKKQSFQTA